SPEAEITFEALSGSGNYEYSITNTAGVPAVVQTLLSSTVIYKAPAPGEYTITIYDTATPNTTACNRVFVVEVPATVLPVFTETNVDVTCNGGTDGSITLSETNNGINPLTYTISPVIGTYNS